MQLTVASLASRTDLGLTILSARDAALTTPIEWAHAIDRDDSDKWIAPGTLVLSSGYHMPEATDTDAIRSRIDALQSAGACALALDTGGRWARIPQVIVDHGEEMGFPIIAVAAEAPFSAVVRAVAENITSARVNRLSALLDQQGKVTTTLLRSGLRSGLKGAVDQVATYLDAAVVIIDNLGAVRASSVTGESLDKALVDKALVKPPYTRQVARSPINPHGIRMIQPLTGAVVGQGAIIVDSRRLLDETDRLLVSFLAAVVSLSQSRSLTVHRVEEKLRRQALRSVIQGITPAQENLELFDLAEESLVTGVYITGESVDLARLNSELLGLGVHFLTTQDAEEKLAAPGNDSPAIGCYAVHDGRADVPRALFNRLRTTYPRMRIGVGERTELRQAALSLTQAKAAAPPPSSRVRVRTIAELPTYEAIVETLSDTDAAQILTGGAFRTLQDYDAVHRTDLVAAASAYINTNGTFEAMARVLGVHRQTARARAQLIEEILDCSLEDPDLRAELWLAMRIANRSS